MDAVKQKHHLLFVTAALTGSLESHDKHKQLTALRGKLRDGTIRGKRARLAAQAEIEKLKEELDAIDGSEKTSSLSFEKEIPKHTDEKLRVSNKHGTASSVTSTKESPSTGGKDNHTCATSSLENELLENGDKRTSKTSEPSRLTWKFPSEGDKSLSDVEVSCGQDEVLNSVKSTSGTASVVPASASDDSPAEFESLSSTQSGKPNLNTQLRLFYKLFVER